MFSKACVCLFQSFSSEVRWLRFKSPISPSLAVCTEVTQDFSGQFPSLKCEGNAFLSWVLDENVHVKHLAQVLTSSEHSVNLCISCYSAPSPSSQMSVWLKKGQGSKPSRRLSLGARQEYQETESSGFSVWGLEVGSCLSSNWKLSSLSLGLRTSSTVNWR